MNLRNKIAIGLLALVAIIPLASRGLKAEATDYATVVTQDFDHREVDLVSLFASVDSKLAAQRLRVQTNGSGTYTWTFPSAYGSGATPIVTVTPEDNTASASADVRITAISNTSVTVQATRITSVLGILSINATPQIYVHLMAVAP